MNVLITGASSGMGKATALKLANKKNDTSSSGAAVASITLMARNEAKLEMVAAQIHEINPNCSTKVVVGDVTVSSDMQRAVDETVQAFGGLTACFLNAGVARGGTELHQVNDGDMDLLINTNIKSVVYGLRAVLP